MAEMMRPTSLHATTIHALYNEKMKSEVKSYERTIRDLNSKITSLKAELSTAYSTNQSLKCKLNSTNNKIRILTSNENKRSKETSTSNDTVETPKTKAKLLANLKKKAKKWPVVTQTSNRINYVIYNKENVAQTKRTTIAKKKPEIAVVKADTNKSKGNIIQKKETTEPKMISLDKTYSTNH